MIVVAVKQLWPQLRAALLLLHLIAVGLASVPAPEGGLNRSAWKDPTVQAELRAWAKRFQGMGWSVSKDELESELWDFSTGYMKRRRQILSPFKTYYRWCGTAQSWRMFVAPHRYPARLFVDIQESEEVQEGGAQARAGGADDTDWHLIYEQDTPGADWMKSTFEHDRFRSVIFRYSWKSYNKSYKQMGAWVAHRAESELPAARRIRLRWYKYRTPSPEEVLEDRIPEGDFILPIVIDLHPEPSAAERVSP